MRLALSLALAISLAAQDLRVQQIAEGFDRPSNIAPAPDGSGWLYVTEQVGLIRVIVDGKLREEPFLDLRDRVYQADPECCQERGLLGLAFPPDYTSRAVFFVNY